MKTKFLASIIIAIFFLSSGFVFVSAQERPAGGNQSPTQTGNTSPTQTGNNNPVNTGNTPAPLSINIENPFKGPGTIQGLFKAIIDNILLPIGGVLAVLAFIYSGFQYVVAMGNPTKISKAHRSLLYSAIGTALVLGAWVVSTVIETTINQLGT